jgi:Xaa-Pro aminopeptidase
MTVTIGHTILAIPGFGGVRFEDIYRVGAAGAGGAKSLSDYPIDPVVKV